MKSLLLISILILRCDLLLTTFGALANNQRSPGFVESPDSSVADYHLKICPDPKNSSLIITYQIYSPTSVQLTLYNILGQQVEGKKMGPVEIGNHRIEFNNLALSSGLYFVLFQTDSCRLIRKFQYVR